MESTTTVHGVSFLETPRDGQLAIYNLAANQERRTLNTQQPTGYGKTRVACGCYSILRKQGRANRMLYVVGTQQQRAQFRIDGPTEFFHVGTSDIRQVCDITYSYTEAIRKHRTNQAEIFVTTVQSIMEGSTGRDTIIEMMSTGLWMVVVDEMHHYGQERAFARAVCDLPLVFNLSMSATPHRKTRDGIFGDLDKVVKYTDAVLEGAVKPLHLHSYTYRVDTVSPDGEINSYTTDELAKAFGLTVGPNGELNGLDKAIIARNLRWSPKYVSPLVERPIQRAVETQLQTGVPAQVLVRAMSISHARLVYEQITTMFKSSDLVIDWVGTGENGRTAEEIECILSGFCPPKREDGRRHPEDVKVNVLIAVGLAGEGMDSTYVTEVVFLTPANDTNENRQTIGRGSRRVPGAPESLRCNINVDSSTTLAQHRGKAIMELMDIPVGEELPPMPDDEVDVEDDELTPLPDEPVFLVLDAELLRVDDGEVRRAGEMLQQMGIEYNVPNNDWSMIQPNDERFQHVLNGLRSARAKEAEQMNEQSHIERWHDTVKKATQKAAGDVVFMMRRRGFRIDKTVVGDIKTRINQQKARDVGPIEKNVETMRRHYQWLVAFDKALRQGVVPPWLV